MKAWEKAYASSHDKILQGDIITYDSYKDLIYAYGENGRNVILRRTVRSWPTDIARIVQGRSVEPQERYDSPDQQRYAADARQENRRPARQSRADGSQSQEGEETEETVQAAYTEPGTQGLHRNVTLVLEQCYGHS